MENRVTEKGKHTSVAGNGGVGGHGEGERGESRGVEGARRTGEDDVKVDEQKLANKCGGLVQTGAVSASPCTRSCLFALRLRRHNAPNDSRFECAHPVDCHPHTE